MEWEIVKRELKTGMVQSHEESFASAGDRK
jgi:hypothetical protein